MSGLTDEDRAELHAAARARGPRSLVSARRSLEAAVETIVARHVAAALHPARPRRLCEVPPDAPATDEVTIGGWTFTPARRLFEPPTRLLTELLTYHYTPAADPEPWALLRDPEPGTRLPVRDQHGEHVADAVFGEIKLAGEPDTMSGWIVRAREDDGD